MGSGLSLGFLVSALVLAGFACSARAQETAAAILPDAPGPIESPYSSSQNAASPAADTCVISGTVLDTNNDIIQGARVVLSDRAGVEHQMESGPNGQFAFPALSPGTYKVTVTGRGMGTYVSPWLTLHPGEMRIVSQVVLPVAAAATSITVNGNSLKSIRNWQTGRSRLPKSSAYGAFSQTSTAATTGTPRPWARSRSTNSRSVP